MTRSPIPRKLILAVWERDEGLCQKCGGQGSSPPHHIAYGGTGRKRVHRVENLITLCMDHHTEAHSTRAMRTWTEDWSRNKYGPVIDELLSKKWSGEK